MEASWPWDREYTFKEFDARGAPRFMGKREHIVSVREYLILPAIEVQQLAREYLTLEHTTKMVAMITAKFRERMLFFPQYAATGEMSMARYHDMLRSEIHEFVSISSCETLSNLVEATRDRDPELDT